MSKFNGTINLLCDKFIEEQSAYEYQKRHIYLMLDDVRINAFMREFLIHEYNTQTILKYASILFYKMAKENQDTIAVSTLIHKVEKLLIRIQSDLHAAVVVVA